MIFVYSSVVKKNLWWGIPQRPFSSDGPIFSGKNLPGFKKPCLALFLWLEL